MNGESDERAAFMDRLPETYNIPAEFAQHWDQVSPDEVIPWTKAAVTMLQEAIDQLCHATVQSTAVASAAYRNDFVAFEAAYEKLGVAAIEAQNALRHAIVELAAGHQIARVQTDKKATNRQAEDDNG